MISRITMTRVKPCFWGNKTVNGEISKVKKETVNNTPSQSQSQTQTQNGVDTFTASESSKQQKKTEKVTVNKK